MAMERRNGVREERSSLDGSHANTMSRVRVACFWLLAYTVSASAILGCVFAFRSLDDSMENQLEALKPDDAIVPSFPACATYAWLVVESSLPLMTIPFYFWLTSWCGYIRTLVYVSSATNKIVVSTFLSPRDVDTRFEMIQVPLPSIGYVIVFYLDLFISVTGGLFFYALGDMCFNREDDLRVQFFGVLMYMFPFPVVTVGPWFLTAFAYWNHDPSLVARHNAFDHLATQLRDDEFRAANKPRPIDLRGGSPRHVNDTEPARDEEKGEGGIDGDHDLKRPPGYKRPPTPGARASDQGARDAFSCAEVHASRLSDPDDDTDCDSDCDRAPGAAVHA